MQDEDKTKESLIEELGAARRRIAELEGEPEQPTIPGAGQNQAASFTAQRAAQHAAQMQADRTGRFLKRLAFLSTAAMELMQFPIEGDLDRFIGEQVSQLCPGAIILINSFAEATSSMTVMAAVGLDQTVLSALQSIGGDPTRRSFPIGQEGINRLLTGRLYRAPLDVQSLTPAVPKEALQEIGEKLSLGATYGMGFLWQGKLLGSLTLVLHKGKRLNNCMTIETFIRQAAVALQRRRAEEALRANERALERVARLAQIGHWYWDLKTNEMKWTKEVYKIFGIQPDGLLVLSNGINLVHAEDRGPLERAIRAALEEKTAYNFEYRVIRPDGTTVWCRAVGEVVYDANGQNIAMQGSIQNISDVKSTKEELTASQSRFEKVFHRAPTLMSLTEVDTGVFVDVNDKFIRTTGFTKEEVIGRSSTELGWISQADRDLIFREVTQHGQIENHEIIGYDKNKREIVCLYCAELVHFDGKERLLSITIDITARKEAEKELAESRLKLAAQNIMLENKNIAFREAMDQIRLEKERLEEKVVSNVELMLLPLLARLSGAGNKKIEVVSKLLEDNLRSLTSSFGKRLSSSKPKLTPRELEICNMVRAGLTTKEIGWLLNISHRSVATHRNNIRKKLNIRNKQINLVSFLADTTLQ